MICFQISIFEPLKTAKVLLISLMNWLWFAFKLVSLNHWKQPSNLYSIQTNVVICFQISIFEPLKTAFSIMLGQHFLLWFAFKLVSLNHWKQLFNYVIRTSFVVICFQISIFEPLKTALTLKNIKRMKLWFAFKLVSLNHWKQRDASADMTRNCCDLLSN